MSHQNGDASLTLSPRPKYLKSLQKSKSNRQMREDIMQEALIESTGEGQPGSSFANHTRFRNLAQREKYIWKFINQSDEPFMSRLWPRGYWRPAERWVTCPSIRTPRPGSFNTSPLRSLEKRSGTTQFCQIVFIIFNKPLLSSNNLVRENYDIWGNQKEHWEWTVCPESGSIS